MFEDFTTCDVVVFGVTSIGVQATHDDCALGFGDEFGFVGEVYDEKESEQTEEDRYAAFNDEDLQGID